LVYIEGPNSSGKSTLLNIVALGLLGSKSRKINPVLLKRMSSLLNSSYQKIKFEIKITSEGESLILRSRKDDLDRSEIALEESIDGESYRPMSFEKFESRYNLIYDIPSNPTERLYDLIEELKEEQLRFGKKFEEFGWHLRGILKEITHYRDPKRLKELSQRLDQVTQQRRDLAEELPRLQDFLDSLEKHAYVRCYYNYLNESERLERTKKEIEAENSRLGKSDRKLSGTFSKLTKQIARLRDDFSGDYNEATPLIANALPKRERPRLEIWKGINTYDTSDFELDRMKIEVFHFLNLFGSELERVQSEGSFRDASILERIIQSLKDFENSSLMIPRIEVTVKELIEILKEESKKNYLLISKCENLKRITGLLERLRDNIDMLRGKLSEAREVSTASKELAERHSNFYYERKSQLRRVSNELSRAREKRDYYFHKCLSKEVDKKTLEEGSFPDALSKLPENEALEPFFSLSENQIEAKISELEEEIVGKRDRMKFLEVVVDQCQRDKERLERQRPHKYEKSRAQLNLLLHKTDSISQKLLSEYNSNVENLIERKVKKSDIEKQEAKKRYYEEVSKYLAHRIGFFRHIDTTYKAKIVDLISGVIITSDDLTIHLSDMGTGQSQSAYLLGLLNVRDDTRRIIAFFDEIAMMDESSLEPVYDRMRELYKAGRLLVGILVQKGNEVEIKALA